MTNPFSSLRHYNYRLYFIGQGVSLIGSWMQVTTLAWLAWDWTHKSRWPGFLLIAQVTPTLLFGSWSGRLADRIPKLPLVICTQCGFLLTAVVGTILVYSGFANIWLLLLVAIVQGFVQAVDLPARLTFVPNLVDKEDIPNTVALNSMQFNIARAIGPAVAGEMLGVLSPGFCLLCNALSYLAVLLSLFLMRNLKAEIIPARQAKGEVGGWAYLGKYPDIKFLLIIAGFVSVCGWPLLSLLPAYVERNLGLKEQAYGRLLSFVGVGAVVGALCVASFGQVLSRARFLRFGISSLALGLGTLSMGNTFWQAAIGCALFGFGMISFLATSQGYVQLTVENAHRGSVMGIWAMMISSGIPAGNLLWAPLADAIGVLPVIASQSAMAFIIVGILFLRGRQVGRMEYI